MEREATIRSAAPADIEAMRALWAATPGIGLSEADDPGPLGRFLDANSESCFVAESGGRLVGTSLGAYDGRRAYLYHVAVAHGHRRQGLANALVGRCLEALARRGARKCHLMALADNELGLGYYAANGWRRRDELVVFSRDLL
jgi:ribosomal protein S18 acetylase RimI-like enzyme